jgi:predicted DNA repair protein MutK
MAGSLLALLDDITTILDDVALLSKTAAQKTAGVLGDDLALNAQQLTGLHPERELPVVRAVAIGSLKNKAILVPAALALSAFLPQAITPLLMIGGAYLCYEGFEKVAHALLPHAAEHAAAAPAPVDAATLERDKIRGAIRTDFILSTEIVVIALGTVADAPFGERLAVVAGVAVALTFGVYGLVAAIVKLDDAGLYLTRRAGPAAIRGVGRLLLGAAPRLMRCLSVAGTAAMFTVGGGILLHGFHGAHALTQAWEAYGAAAPAWAAPMLPLWPIVLEALAGLAAGALALAAVALVQAIMHRLRRR